jgi:hypothetical protein
MVNGDNDFLTLGQIMILIRILCVEDKENYEWQTENFTESVGPSSAA